MGDIEETNALTLSILEEAPSYHRWIFGEMKPWLGEVVLEVGCGVGNLTGLLLQHGKVIPTDVNKRYLQTVERKFHGHPHLKRTFLWDIRRPLPETLMEHIDSIVCSNVLEHIEEDEHVLANFYQLLPRGGRLILLVPALKRIYNLLDRELGHVRRYSRKELGSKLKAQGFKIRRLTYLNRLGVLGWFVNGTLLRRRVLPVKQVRAFNKLVPFFTLMERIIPPVVGQSLVAIGEKEGEEA